MIFSLEILIYLTANDSWRLIYSVNHHAGSRAMSSFERGTLSVVNKPAGSVHHLEPRVLKMAGTRGARKTLDALKRKLKFVFSQSTKEVNR